MKNKKIETRCLGSVDKYTEKQLNDLIDRLTYTKGNTTSQLIEKNGKVYQQIIESSQNSPTI